MTVSTISLFDEILSMFSNADISDINDIVQNNPSQDTKDTVSLFDNIFSDNVPSNEVISGNINGATVQPILSTPVGGGLTSNKMFDMMVTHMKTKMTDIPIFGPLTSTPKFDAVTSTSFVTTPAVTTPRVTTPPVTTPSDTTPTTTLQDDSEGGGGISEESFSDLLFGTSNFEEGSSNGVHIEQAITLLGKVDNGFQIN